MCHHCGSRLGQSIFLAMYTERSCDKENTRHWGLYAGIHCRWPGMNWAGMRHQYGGSFLALLRDVFLSSFLSEPTLLSSSRLTWVSVCIPLPVTDTSLLRIRGCYWVKWSCVELRHNYICVVRKPRIGDNPWIALRKAWIRALRGQSVEQLIAQSTDCATHTCVRVFGIGFGSLKRAGSCIMVDRNDFEECLSSSFVQKKKSGSKVISIVCTPAFRHQLHDRYVACCIPPSLR